MKASALFTTQLATLSLASPHLARQVDNPHEWMPAGPDDFRGPCPMMNTLANHGHLPRDGRNITKANAVTALTGGLNFDTSLAELMFDMAIRANPEPNATFFTLDHLNVHNVLEHDASLSRTDDFFGSNHIFNQTIFDSTRKYWTGDVLTADMLANSKVFRQIESKAFNPEYKFTANTEAFSLGEVAAPIVAFGDLQEFTVPKNLVEYFFENERFPTELGWTLREEITKGADIMRVSGAIEEATNLLTGEGDAKKKLRRGDFHAGLGF